MIAAGSPTVFGQNAGDVPVAVDSTALEGKTINAAPSAGQGSDSSSGIGLNVGLESGRFARKKSLKDGQITSSLNIFQLTDRKVLESDPVNFANGSNGALLGLVLEDQSLVFHYIDSSGEPGHFRFSQTNPNNPDNPITITLMIIIMP